MRVSLIFLLLFWLGVVTYHLVEGGRDEKKQKSSGGSKSPTSPKKPQVSRRPSEKNRFQSVVGAMKQERQSKLSASRRYSRDGESRPSSPGGSPSRFPLISDMTPEQAEQTCAQQLSEALAKMELGNLLKQDLNLGMAMELESQLIGHFEHGAQPDDFMMDFNEFKTAQKGVGPREPIPKQEQPVSFNLGSEPLAGEEKMTSQRRCSKRCLWLYGYLVRPVQRTEDQAEGVTISNERIVNPITDGYYQWKPWAALSSVFGRQARRAADRCTCEPSTDFLNTLDEYDIKKESAFRHYQKTSSGEAMRFLDSTLKQEKKGLGLMEHEEFVELVTFEILKHIRPKKTPQEIMKEVRNGVTLANEAYRGLMKRPPPPPPRITDAKSLIKKLSSFGRQSSKS